jgi:hypothetical protein
MAMNVLLTTVGGSVFPGVGWVMVSGIISATISNYR